MKLSLIVLLAALVAVATANRKRPTKFKEYACSDVTDNADKDFENFIKCHFRGYSADRDDKYLERRSRFEKCRKAALRNDPDRTGYSVGLTRFCFWTSEELRASQNYLLDEDDSVDVNLPVTSDIHLVKTRATPVNFSWVDYGAVSSVKDQQKCGDCYTFAAAGALEGAYQIKYGQLYNLSVQQYTSCSRNYTTSTVTYTSCTGSDCTSWTQEKWYLSTSGNDGCNGGTYTACWAYNNMTGLGTNSWECYPFTSGYGNVPACSRSTTCSVNVAAKDYVKIPKNNETMLFNAVATAGPVACSIDSTNLSSYTGGVFNGTSTSVNHAVLVVGFGTTSAGQDYWVVKNSWGSDWGINGYFWLARGTNAIAIAKSCAYPLV